MPPRHQTLPPAQTQAARDALQSFHCALCQKGYSRMNDYEAHLSSYDHSHKQRLKDMKRMVRDPNATARARRQEARAGGVISIRLGGDEGGEDNAAAGAAGAGAGGLGGGLGGFKKGGFKKTGFKSAYAPADAPGSSGAEMGAGRRQGDAAEGGLTRDAHTSSLTRGGGGGELVESDTDEDGYELYNPNFPTD